MFFTSIQFSWKLDVAHIYRFKCVSLEKLSRTVGMKSLFSLIGKILSQGCIEVSNIFSLNPLESPTICDYIKAKQMRYQTAADQITL